MQTTLIQSPEISDAQRMALAICDSLKGHWRAEDSYTAIDVAWFREQIILGFASWCTACTMPMLGSFCHVCRTIPAARLEERDSEWMEVARRSETTEKRACDLAYTRIKLIGDLSNFQSDIDSAADYIVFAEIGKATELEVASQMQEAA